MSMSKKDYEAVAEVVLTYKQAILSVLTTKVEQETALVVVDGLVGRMVARFEADNTRFDKDRFIAALSVR